MKITRKIEGNDYFQSRNRKKKGRRGRKKGKLSILARDQKDSRTKEIKRGSEVGERMNSGPYK